jgi:hypothetical protein
MLVTECRPIDVQIAARHARKYLERHPNYIPAAYMASGI